METPFQPATAATYHRWHTERENENNLILICSQITQSKLDLFNAWISLSVSNRNSRAQHKHIPLLYSHQCAGERLHAIPCVHEHLQIHLPVVGIFADRHRISECVDVQNLLLSSSSSSSIIFKTVGLVIAELVVGKHRLSPPGPTTKFSVYSTNTHKHKSRRCHSCWKWESPNWSYAPHLFYKFTSNCFLCHCFFCFKLRAKEMQIRFHCRPFVRNVYCLSGIRHDSYLHLLLHRQHHYFAEILTLRYAQFLHPPLQFSTSYPYHIDTFPWWCE